MAQEVVESFGRTPEERLEIAKEVVIKALLPEVFRNVPEGMREEVFDRWYGKLMALISREDAEEKAPERVSLFEEEKAPQKRASSLSVPLENKATDKQIKKIFAVGRSLGYGKEDIEETAHEVLGVAHLSELDKAQASRLIEALQAQSDMQEIYG